MIRLLRFNVLMMLLLVLCGGCARRPAATQRVLSPQLTLNQYIALAAQSQGEQADAYNLQAIAILLQRQKLSRAQYYLSKISAADLAAELQPQYYFYQARITLLLDKYESAINRFNTILSTGLYLKLNSLQQIQVNQWLATAYAKQGLFLSSLQYYDQALSLLSAQDKVLRQQLLGQIWQMLLHQKISTLQQQKSQATSSESLGWLQLSLIAKQKMSWDDFLTALKLWQKQYKNHPAHDFLQNQISNQSQVIPSPLKKVAVILPSDGPYVSSANAVRHGILAAYYYSLKGGAAPLNLSFINIVQGDVVGAYQRALADQDQVIIGPLDKNNLSHLVESTNITVPTIALNRLPADVSPPALLYQFSLSPDDEAQQIALAAWQHGHTHALVIAPRSPWGKSLAGVFSKQFISLGGKVNGQVNYTDQRNLSSDIMHLLNVDQSYARRNLIRSLLGKPVRFIARRRQDFDMVFIIAPPVIARQIQPLLKYYYAGGIPIYSTSIIYSGTPSPRNNQDLNGVIFCDMPWVLQKTSQLPPELAAIRMQVKKDWPREFIAKPRLFALGVDSFYLLQRINRFNLLRHSEALAASGHLSLLDNRQVYRSLPLSYFKNGRTTFVK